MSAIQPIKLSVLTGKINNAIEDAFAHLTFWVIADVTNHTFKPASNYHYFELVEKVAGSLSVLAKIGAKAWGQGSVNIANFERLTGQQFTNNINVLVNVSVSYSEVYGLQLTVNDIDANFTLGLLAQQRQATLDRLLAENPDFISKQGDQYITRNNQLDFPVVVQRIAVISSKTSAGFQDFKHSLAHNSFGYQFVVDDYYSQVQGEANAAQVVEQMIAVFKSLKQYDVLVIIRGGGAQTDFLLFDTYAIGKAIAKYPIPVITGIGHQKNETIADLMAHSAVKTPTKAAEMIIAHNKAFEDRLLQLRQLILIRTQQKLSVQLQILSRLNGRVSSKTSSLLKWHSDRLLVLNRAIINGSRTKLTNTHKSMVNLSVSLVSNPKMMLLNKFRELEYLQGNLKLYQKAWMLKRHTEIAHYISIFRLMHPANILKKGFAIVKYNKAIVPNANTIEEGSKISVIFADAELEATVGSKTKHDGNEFDL